MKTLRTIVSLLLVGCLLGCQQFQVNDFLNSDRSKESLVLAESDSNLSEVAIPKTIRELKRSVEQYSPQVKIIAPQTGKTFNQTDIEIELAVTDLPLFQDDRLKLGNHLSLIVDNEALLPVYDLDEPFLLKNLMPGTHTVRIFATTPWGESFKNQGAYAQTTFNVLTETNSNYPDSKLPLLTYNSPTGIYGAEPILLDFYLDDPNFSSENTNDLKKSLVKATVNGKSLIIEKWQSYYLTGFKPGKNWVQLELIDEFGNNIENTFNNTVRVFDYDPKQQDTLSKLVTNQISSGEARPIIEQNYYIQPVETLEPTDIENRAESEITLDQLDDESAITGDRSPEETIPTVLNNQSKEIEAAPEETTPDSFGIEERESSSTNTLPVTIPQIISETESDLEAEKDLQHKEKSLPPKSINKQDFPNKPANIDSTIDPLQPESTPNKISIKESEATQQPLVEIIIPEPESVETSKSEATNPQPVLTEKQPSKNPALPLKQGFRETEILENTAVEKDAIASSTRLTETVASKSLNDSTGNRPATPSLEIAESESEIALSAPEETGKFLWWKKILVALRQTIESLARQLPNQV